MSTDRFEQLQAVFIGVAAIALLIFIPILAIKLRRQRRGHTPTSGQSAYEAAKSLAPGTVRFTFHKYSGFLVWMKETRYDDVLTIDAAETLLKTLVRHNLTWGLLTYGGIFVPFFTFFEWRAQKKRITIARPGFEVTDRVSKVARSVAEIEAGRSER